MSKRFEGRRVLVTGGNSGIGLAAAQAFLAEGAEVVITGRNEASLRTAVRQLGTGAQYVVNDAANAEGPNQLADYLTQEGLMLDAAFFNAGIAPFAPFPQITPDVWDSAFATNVKGVYFQIQALLPRFNRGASLVLNGSINAKIGMPNSSLYAATKAALISLARTLSAELIPNGVRVNVVSPGPISTPLYGKLGMSEQELQGLAGHIQSQIPLGRFGTSEELASTVLHLASPESAFVVGTEIVVDGGMSQL
jgi:NAD(P)-dependent dehydrogenase (short-subunit alcohol dehydrogenase family)